MATGMGVGASTTALVWVGEGDGRVTDGAATAVVGVAGGRVEVEVGVRVGKVVGVAVGVCRDAAVAVGRVVEARAGALVDAR